MKKRLREYFMYSRRERNGLTVLLALLLISILCRIYAGYFIEEKRSSFQINESELQALLLQLDKLEEEPKHYSSSNYLPNRKTPGSALKEFDPNSITAEEWIKLGFSPNQAASIIKYRTMIGGFETADQLKNCFVIDEERFNLLEPFINLSPALSKESYFNKEIKEQKKTAPVFPKPDLNFSTLEEITLIRGIGDHTAKLIIDYRQRIGGFSNLNQLYEIKGLDSTRIELLKKESVLTQKVFKRIDINSATYADLRNHPYIEQDLARLIVRFRELHGKYESVESLKKLALVDTVVYKRIFPYLKVQE